MKEAQVWIDNILVERFSMIVGGVNYAAWRREPKGFAGDHGTITCIDNVFYGKIGTRCYDGPDCAYGTDERIAAVSVHYAKERALAIKVIRAAFPEAKRHEMQV